MDGIFGGATRGGLRAGPNGIMIGTLDACGPEYAALARAADEHWHCQKPPRHPDHRLQSLHLLVNERELARSTRPLLTNAGHYLLRRITEDDHCQPSAPGPANWKYVDVILFHMAV